MSHFLTPLDVRVHEEREGGRLVYELLAPFRYESTLLGRVLEVPTGFVTDFESVPRTLAGFSGPICPRTGVVHDWLYRTHALGTDAAAKDRSDAVAREAWECEGLDPVYAEQRLAAVDFYGWSAWECGQPGKERPA